MHNEYKKIIHKHLSPYFEDGTMSASKGRTCTTYSFSSIVKGDAFIRITPKNGDEAPLIEVGFTGYNATQDLDTIESTGYILANIATTAKKIKAEFETVVIETPEVIIPHEVKSGVVVRQYQVPCHRA